MVTLYLYIVVQYNLSYSNFKDTVPVTETCRFWNRTTAVETLQSVGRFLTTSRRLQCRSKDVPFYGTVAPFSIKR